MASIRKIIKSNPAPYPPTNTPEIKAVITFLAILNVDRIKPDVKFLDKIPNTDGTLEIVNEAQIPIGKLDVQVKVLEPKNYLTPKYQCKASFLSACENSILPVLLIVVNTDQSIAYWHHIDNYTLEVLAKKMKGESVNLDLSQTNIISKNSLSYVDEWVKIIDIYKTKIYDYDNLKRRKQKLEDEVAEFKKATVAKLGKKDSAYIEIHRFLDFYNHLLDHDFKTIKDIRYPEYWKIGIGIDRYQEHSVAFTLYPVAYDVNDVLIKHHDDNRVTVMRNALHYIGHNLRNPIKQSPKQYAYELIASDTEKALKDPLFVRDEFLAKEYIIAFIDKFHKILGLQFGALTYNLSEIEVAVNVFMPLWIERVIINQPPVSRPIPFMIDHISFHMFASAIEEISKEVQQLVEKGTKPTRDIKIVSEEFHIAVLLNMISFCRSRGTTILERDYATRHEVNKLAYRTWEAWGEDKTIKNISLFYRHLSRVYEMLVSTYFPNLMNELDFFNGFDLLVVIVNFTRVEVSHDPVTESYYLKSTGTPGKDILVFSSEDPSVPFTRESAMAQYNSGITVKGRSYELKRCEFSALTFIYEETPLLNSVNEILRTRMTEFLKEKTQGQVSK